MFEVQPPSRWNFVVNVLRASTREERVVIQHCVTAAELTEAMLREWSSSTRKMRFFCLGILIVFVVEDVAGATKESKAAGTGKKVKKEKTGKEFWFSGKDQWYGHTLDLCFKQTPLPDDFNCYKYYWNYEPVYIDPVSTNPIIIIYRRFIPKKLIDGFLYDYRRKQKRMEKNTDDDFMRDYIKNYKRRQANETTISHKSMSGVARVFNRVQSLIPMLNFSISGHWQVLSYRRGGHHAPHYDYITYSSPDQYSKTTRKYGNRFVTFSITLKEAEVGGATTFVHLNQTVRMSSGDVLMFTNIDKDMKAAVGSAHGECPVEKGEKITATLFLRPRGQELFHSHPQDPKLFQYDIEKLINPNMEFYRKSPFYDLYFFQEEMMARLSQQYAENEA
ncbi:hypothetical protein Q1695_003196 [Nippostrongylus brasiliensis]|nr:hypothetical protein Q1695_003196 [Nippostrongylus brasiliensis]